MPSYNLTKTYCYAPPPPPLPHHKSWIRPCVPFLCVLKKNCSFVCIEHTYMFSCVCIEEILLFPFICIEQTFITCLFYSYA